MQASTLKIARVALVLATLWATAASQPLWAQAQAQAHMHGTTAPAKTTDMKSMMKDGDDKMAAMVMTGDPDIDFAMMMRIHHQGGVDMAKAQLRDGRNPQMRKMAQDIIDAQNHEIAIFEKFLAKKGHPVDKSKK